MTTPVLNLADVALASRPAATGTAAARYHRRRGEIASRIDARQLGYKLTAVVPGMSACPCHSHRAEEGMFLILDGTGELRHGEARYRLRTGGVIAYPTGGPETAHQILNNGSTELRHLAVSTIAATEICESPDSGKLSAFVENKPEMCSAPERFRHIGRAADARDYRKRE